MEKKQSCKIYHLRKKYVFSKDPPVWKQRAGQIITLKSRLRQLHSPEVPGSLALDSLGDFFF